MTILFAGTPQNAADSLAQLVRAGVPISLVLTRPDSPVGRKRVMTPSAVAITANELGIPVLKKNAIDEEASKVIASSKLDFAIVIAFGVLLTSTDLELLPRGWFNVHYSVLPRWRGAAPVQRSLISGDTETGVTVFKIDEGLDTGPIAGVARTVIEPSEDSERLLRRLSTLGVSLLLELIPQIQSGLVHLSPQSSAGSTTARKVSRQEAELDLGQSSSVLENLIRGCFPEPGAWVRTSAGSELKVLSAKSLRGRAHSIGDVELFDHRVVVGCGEGSLELLTVQPAGKRPMEALDWYRGLPADFKLGFND